MSQLTDRANGMGSEFFGALQPHTHARILGAGSPVLATPAAVAAAAAGVTAAVGAGAAGYAAEEAADG